MGDWLGTGRRIPGVGWRTFDKARAFVRRLSLKSQADWVDYCSSGKKPADVPSSPEYVYAKEGWMGYGDWLGTGAVSNRVRQYRSLKRARAFVRRLGLKSRDEWDECCKSGKKPTDIPAAPWQKYAGHRLEDCSPTWRNFQDARTFVRGLRLKSVTEWNNYCRSGKKPADIPYGPAQVYAGRGWRGWGDWLGTGRIASQLQPFRSFPNAREFVRGLKLKSQKEWKDYW